MFGHERERERESLPRIKSHYFTSGSTPDYYTTPDYMLLVYIFVTTVDLSHYPSNILLCMYVCMYET